MEDYPDAVLSQTSKLIVCGSRFRAERSIRVLNFASFQPAQVILPNMEGHTNGHGSPREFDGHSRSC